MLKALFRSAFYGAAVYGAYTVARKYFPKEIDSAVDMATKRAQSLAKDVTSNIGETAKSITGSAKSATSSIDHNVRKAV